MANTRQSTKRARQERKRQTRNNLAKSKAKSVVKNAILAITKKTNDSAEAYLAAVRALSKAASRGVIPKQRAARKISRMTLLAKKANPAALSQK